MKENNTQTVNGFFHKYWWLFYLAFFFLLGVLIYSFMYNNQDERSNERISRLNRQLEDCEKRSVVENDSIRVISNEGQFGCLSFTLVWNSTDDLDLHVTDARNNRISFENYCKTCENKFSSAGGQLDVDLNAGEVNSYQPVENVYFKCKPPVGVYTARVHMYTRRNNNPVAYKLLIRDNGSIVRELQGTINFQDEVLEIIRYNYNEST